MNDVPLIETWTQLSAIILPFLVRCGAAALCGAVIGLERELKGKAAGFRTNILICVGSAIYMCVGLLLVGAGGRIDTDPARIAAQVVTGIGFLGAGCILQAGGRVTGLTTAATIWVVASIGLVAGAGFPLLAFISAWMVVITLAVLGELETRYLDRPRTEE
jgi:putative Mg2+ transporter-C (MgtC) family protein